MYAAYFNRIEVGKLLISRGADMDIKSKSGETALSIALDEGRTEFADMLKRAGAK
jgi:ankyrin repeat protein